MTNTAQATDRRVIDAYAVALDETDHYNLDPADARYIKRIDGVYLFDAREQTHCCELTASYWLIYLYTSIVFTDDADDAVREALDEKYAHEPSDDIYVHCGSIDKIIREGKRDRIDHYGDCAEHDFCDEIADADKRHDAEMEEIREDLQGYCPF